MIYKVGTVEEKLTLTQRKERYKKQSGGVDVDGWLSSFTT